MKHFSFVLIPRFSMLAFSSALDALRSANMILGRDYYTWQTICAEGSSVISSSDIDIPATPIDKALAPDVIAICGGDSSHNFHHDGLAQWVHKYDQQGATIGSFSDGAFVAAEMGLFNKAPSTIHWRCFDAYRELFPNLEIKPSIIEISQKRFSCAGGTSSLDLMLHLIRVDHGDDLVGQIANNYFHDTIRDDSAMQHVTTAFKLANQNPTLSSSILLMEENLETPLTIEDISIRLNISHRQLDRIFKQYLGTSPKSHYQALRLFRASNLLLQTSMSVTEISLACGYQSASHLASFFSRQYRKTPKEFRKANLAV